MNPVLWGRSGIGISPMCAWKMEECRNLIRTLSVSACKISQAHTASRFLAGSWVRRKLSGNSDAQTESDSEGVTDVDSPFADFKIVINLCRRGGQSVSRTGIKFILGVGNPQVKTILFASEFYSGSHEPGPRAKFLAGHAYNPIGSAIGKNNRAVVSSVKREIRPLNASD